MESWHELSLEDYSRASIIIRSPSDDIGDPTLRKGGSGSIKMMNSAGQVSSETRPHASASGVIVESSKKVGKNPVPDARADVLFSEQIQIQDEEISDENVKKSKRQSGTLSLHSPKPPRPSKERKLVSSHGPRPRRSSKDNEDGNKCTSPIDIKMKKKSSRNDTSSVAASKKKLKSPRSRRPSKETKSGTLSLQSPIYHFYKEVVVSLCFHQEEGVIANNADCSSTCKIVTSISKYTAPE